MHFLKTITRNDASLYYRHCYAVTKKGTPVMIRDIQDGGDPFIAKCYIKDTGADMWAREKDFSISSLILDLPRLGYINDYEHTRVVYTKRRVSRASTRLLSSENLSVINAFSGASVEAKPSLIRQLYNPAYVAPDKGLSHILECSTPAVAISPDICLVFSAVADSIILKFNETPAAFYIGNKTFKLLEETVDYLENINQVFGGRLNATC